MKSPLKRAYVSHSPGTPTCCDSCVLLQMPLVLVMSFSAWSQTAHAASVPLTTKVWATSFSGTKPRVLSCSCSLAASGKWRNETTFESWCAWRPDNKGVTLNHTSEPCAKHICQHEPLRLEEFRNFWNTVLELCQLKQSPCVTYCLTLQLFILSLNTDLPCCYRKWH